MSKPRHDWWPYVKNMIRRYPDLAVQHEQALRQRTTACYAGPSIPGKSTKRPLEDCVIRAMSGTEYREFEAVRLAIKQTEAKQSGDLQMQIIRMVFWQRSHTLEGAAKAVHVSYRTARRWHTNFIKRVAGNFGLD